MDNDTLDFMDQLERTVIAIFQRLRGLAPAAVQDRIGGGDARGMRGVFRAHDADKDVDRRLGMAARKRAYLGDGFGQPVMLRHRSRPAYVRAAPYRRDPW